ncbi:MAG: hypothetical protein WCY36_08280 [Candidatus Omnitrophota bacterium]
MNNPSSYSIFVARSALRRAQSESREQTIFLKEVNVNGFNINTYCSYDEAFGYLDELERDGKASVSMVGYTKDDMAGAA